MRGLFRRTQVVASALTLVCAMAGLASALGAAAGPAQAQAKQYPYRLVDPGTFGGPGSFVVLPGLPITSNGTVLGTADTITPDPDLPVSDFNDGYVQHAFTWRSGQLVDLGALAPAADNNSGIFERNGNGVGAGGSENGRIDPLTGSPAQEATIFDHGRVIGLGTLGGHESFAQDINSRGQVAGMSSNSTPDPFSCSFLLFCWRTETRAFVWRNGVMTDLGTLGGPDAVETRQNARGQIDGLSFTNSTANAVTGIPTTDPFLWENGHMLDLGSLGGTFGGVGDGGLNNKGEVVGMSDLAGDQNAHPFLWRHGKMLDLGTPNGDFGFANYINQRGDSTGAYFASDGNFHGVLWHHGKMVDLPPVGGAAQAFGNAINDRDQVVGNQSDSNFNEVSAALWTGGHGYDLNTLVAPSDFQMISADYIDNRGEIFGHGLYTSGPNAGNARVFVLIRNPSVPLPAGSTAGRLLPRTHPANLSALALSTRVGPGRGTAMSAEIRRILLDQRR